MKEIIMKWAPIWIQNLAISIYNWWQYRVRHGGSYKEKRKYFKDAELMNESDLHAAASARLKAFLTFACEKSDWYKPYHECHGLSDFPILDKHQLVANLASIATIPEAEAVVNLTGGTTGASMKVYYTKEDTQERHALLDHFRESYGYHLGKKTAWFSGKSLAREKDLMNGICYRDDWINKIRFFSTFHICDQYFDAYWKALVDFQPEFIVGFPSSVFDICMLAKQKGLVYPGSIKVFFPTAETILPNHREVIGEVLGCRLVDQYASSEGAPFILECAAGTKHIHPLTGVFEVVNEDLQASVEGEILVTSFTTHGTPLIRYRIGDRLKLMQPDFECPCGSVFPSVEHIDGRNSDFIFSPENGKVNLGNLSNCTKDVEGIVCFQLEQKSADEITVRIVSGPNFDAGQQDKFVRALKERVGDGMTIIIIRVERIAREKSGKFRLVKNSFNNP